VSRGKGRGRKSRSGLTGEEQALWDHAAETMTPLQDAKDRVRLGVDDVNEFELAMGIVRKPERGPGATLPGLPVVPPDHPLVAGRARRTPELADFDRKSARKIRSGQIDIAARLDLHGMRQDEAHGALVAFLMRNYRRDQRWVLIITGKGAVQRTGLARTDHDANMDGERRGVLRRLVPLWLAEPELRAIVVSYTTAGAQHGGEGALYVQLRNAMKSGG
jgi:DNA-nicking Smr family endonuclease